MKTKSWDEIRQFIADLNWYVNTQEGFNDLLESGPEALHATIGMVAGLEWAAGTGTIVEMGDEHPAVVTIQAIQALKTKKGL